MVKRNLTGSHYGVMSWLYQRVTAVLMLMFVFAFLAFVLNIAMSVDGSIVSWQSLNSCLWVKVFLQIFFLALLIHAWVGIRDLWMDYVSCAGIRLVLHSLTILWLLSSLIYSIKVIWG